MLSYDRRLSSFFLSAGGAARFHTLKSASTAHSKNMPRETLNCFYTGIKVSSNNLLVLLMCSVSPSLIDSRDS